MTLNRSLCMGACCSFFGLLLSAEVFFRVSVPSGFWYQRFDLSGDMTSLAEIKDRLRYAAPDNGRVLLLGDSVLGASALTEHRLPDARSKTLSQDLKSQLSSHGYNALSLGSDGLLLPDIESLSFEFMKNPPRRIVLLLNFRMFAQDFNEGPKALSRHFLLAELPANIQKRLSPEKPPSQEAKLGDRLYDGMAENWILFRETQTLKTLWYYPSQKDFFQRFLELVVGKNETQSDMVEAALKQKIASYYQPYLWDPQGLPFTCLKNILDAWSEKSIQVTVILTPQNQKFLGSYLDKPSFEKNRKRLALFMKPYASKGIHYEDWAVRYPSQCFLDHCHLNPEGNNRYAKDLNLTLSKERAR